MTIPFLVDFTPYSPDGILTESINDMVSIDVEQTVDKTDIFYELGYTKNINLPVSIKNITRNTQLQVTLNFDKNLLETTLSDKFLLAPEETKTFFIRLKTETLNGLDGSTDVDFEIVVENPSSGVVVTKNENVTLLNKIPLGKTLTVVT